MGNLTDDAQSYEYVYDPFGRLRKVKYTSNAALVAEYTYSGLGHRIGWHYDVDADGTVEDTSDDPWFRFVYDERWRIVGTFRASDSSPKEQFIYHNAGADGRGGSSYIDTVICRDRDANVNWADAADGTLEERIYYCHNWRGDVSVLIEDDADMVEWVKYSSYGIPFGLPKGDADSDGDVDVGDTADTDQIQTWIDAPAYDVRGDLNLDGFVDATDKSLASSVALGWGNLSLDPDSGAGNRKGYAGYEFDSALSGIISVYHVRNRVLHARLGRWTRRDPLGYVDGANLYQYVSSNPLSNTDETGLGVLYPITCLLLFNLAECISCCNDNHAAESNFCLSLDPGWMQQMCLMLANWRRDCCHLLCAFVYGPPGFLPNVCVPLDFTNLRLPPGPDSD